MSNINTRTIKSLLFSALLGASIQSGLCEALPPTEGLQLWLRADAGVSVSNNGYVTEWLDQSGRGRDFAWINEGERNAPQVSESAVAGKPAVSFDGKVQLFRNNPDVNLFASDAVDIFMVIKPTVAGGFTSLQLQLPDDKEARFSVQLFNEGSWFFDYGNINVEGGRITGPAPEGWMEKTHILEVLREDTGNGTISVDFTPVVSGIFGEGLSQTKAGRLALMGGGDIAEILIYNRSLSASERTLVNSYLKAKYPSK